MLFRSGLGRFGRSVAKELFEMGHEVLGVDKDEENVQAIKEKYSYLKLQNLFLNIQYKNDLSPY